MKQIRTGLFETNSSSTHVLTMCSDEEYKAWLDGKLLYGIMEESLVNYDNKDLPEDAYLTKEAYDEWIDAVLDDRGGDVIEQTYMGVHAFGYYTRI